MVTDTLLFLDMVPDALQWDITRSCSKTGRAMVPYLGSSFAKESIVCVSRCFICSRKRGVLTYMQSYGFVCYFVCLLPYAFEWLMTHTTCSFALPLFWLKTRSLVASSACVAKMCVLCLLLLLSVVGSGI